MEFNFTLNKPYTDLYVNFYVGNKEVQYDALVNIECTGAVSDIVYPTDIIIPAQKKRMGSIKINKNNSLEETINCKVVNVLLESDTLENEKTYKIIFDPNTGNLNQEYKYVIYGEKIGTLPIPEKEGYTFLGWYSELNGGSLVTEHNVYTSEANIVLYARWKTFCIYENGQVFTFTQKKYGQEFDVPCPGNYRIELWGAQGGDYNSNGEAGKGGYVAGNISLKRNDKLYVYVGELVNTYNTQSFNGGYSSGGGATDIRLTNGDWDNFNSLKSRIMVAGGGGYYYKSNFTVPSGAGGGLTGGNGNDTTGGTQTSGGVNSNNSAANGSFGVGGR